MRKDMVRRQATLLTTAGSKLDVVLFLDHLASNGSGRRATILDNFNSERFFIPMEDVAEKEIILLGKSQILAAELAEKDRVPETFAASEIPVLLKLTDGGTVEGSFHVDLPPEKSRLSDYLNTSPQFVYLYRVQNDFILNRDHIFSVKQMSI